MYKVEKFVRSIFWFWIIIMGGHIILCEFEILSFSKGIYLGGDCFFFVFQKEKNKISFSILYIVVGKKV